MDRFIKALGWIIGGIAASTGVTLLAAQYAMGTTGAVIMLVGWVGGIVMVERGIGAW